MTLNQGYVYRREIGPECLGHTAVTYFSRFYTHSTESQWRTRFEEGEIQIDDHTASASELLKPGMIVEWYRPAWNEEQTPQSYKIVYCDDDLIVADKPSGLPTLPGAGFYRNTLLSLLTCDFPTAKPVHRLGRATSGLVLFALSPQAASNLCRKWGEVQKQYVALGEKIAMQELYDIQTPIGLADHPRLGQVHAANTNGKQARSVAKTIERRSESTLFEVALHTGRPHQIRIHLASIGHPLVGDPLYASGGIPLVESPGLPGDGGYWLHANRLIFEHPSTGEVLDLVAEPPSILQATQS